MLKVSLLEIVLRGIPEELLLIFAVYAFSKTAINIKRYMISSILFLAVLYLIRLLPIEYGVHTILGLICMILLTVNINKIPIIKCIKASIFTLILEIICEGVSIFIMKYIFKLDVNYVLKEPTLKILYGSPSLLIFACFVTPYYIRALKRKELRDVFNGEIS